MRDYFKESDLIEKDAEIAAVGSLAREHEREIIEDRKKQIKETPDELRKNKNFTQLDDVGIRALDKILDRSPKAGRLFLRLLPMMDGRGAIVVSRSVLAEIAGVAPKNLNRLTNELVRSGLIRDINIKGTPIIAINPEIAWRNANNMRRYAIFNANVVISADEYEHDDDYDIRRGTALIAMAKKRKGCSKNNDQPELDPPVGERAIDPEILD